MQGRVEEAHVSYAEALAMQQMADTGDGAQEAHPSSTANSDAADDEDWETGIPSPYDVPRQRPALHSKATMQQCQSLRWLTQGWRTSWSS